MFQIASPQPLPDFLESCVALDIVVDGAASNVLGCSVI